MKRVLDKQRPSHDRKARIAEKRSHEGVREIEKTEFERKQCRIILQNRLDRQRKRDGNKLADDELSYIVRRKRTQHTEFNKHVLEINVKTATIDGKRLAKFDKDIIGNLLLNKSTPSEVREEKMIIGIRNEAGEIYRLIGATKLNSYMNAVEELFDLGLTDELQDHDGTQDGCDSIFSMP